ncbi:hypothetical protein I350_00584 [Cryptococcus amylolentus CBS 6273]|uniref:3-hydroxyisobutyrate dehydrogenase n=1 Tax=Cryptococcus amylolentus CBS 6273 TaxID=1296118 RepID=A0A1E3KFE5_9TREE|nr:hypothetical protein I350_00584 [Cryptococcus amylolentus CBS 6273]
MLRPTPKLLRTSTTGWIGLGAMGRPMALNLFTKTYFAHQGSDTPPSLSQGGEKLNFLFCEQDDGRADSFVRDLRDRGGVELAERVERVGSGKEMVQAAAKVFTMLPSTPQVEAVYLDPVQGILAGLQGLPGNTSDLPLVTAPQPNVSGNTSQAVDEQLSSTTTLSSGPPPNNPHTLLIDQTTLDPTVALAVSTRIHQETSHKALMVDAPVSGGTVGAEKGELTIMFGSPSAVATELVVPLLQRMARAGGVVECGGNGTGVGVKVCNNLVLACNQIALAEGLSLGHSLGIDPSLLRSVIDTSSGSSWSSRINPPISTLPNTPASRGYKGGFQTKLMLKDVGLALQAAHKHSLPTPLTWASKSVYEAVCEEGDGDWGAMDFSVVYEWIRKKQRDGVEKGWKD